jgi:hypothetical protein
MQYTYVPSEICRNDNPPICLFLEFKTNIPSNPGKRMGITKGWQEEILRRKPAYFERYLRWIICNNENNDNMYVFATSDIIRKNIRRGLGDIGGKQNNINPNIFKQERLLTQVELLNAIADFLQMD